MNSEFSFECRLEKSQMTDVVVAPSASLVDWVASEGYLVRSWILVLIENKLKYQGKQMIQELSYKSYS